VIIAPGVKHGVLRGARPGLAGRAVRADTGCCNAAELITMLSITTAVTSTGLRLDISFSIAKESE